MDIYRNVVKDYYDFKSDEMENQLQHQMTALTLALPNATNVKHKLLLCKIRVKLTFVFKTHT